ncbi:hypothetical protein A2335_02355 [Candidatus Peregrinibacteria bacterium RIFOXYB2_FULL_32_7]|nr:MAG: hypothetical protein A2335_02355 [Candidatus Peregrinibacteria bacterium RIFOXYB2_FULL_32_7]
MPNYDQNLSIPSEEQIKEYLKSLGLEGNPDEISFKDAMNNALQKLNENFEDGGTCHRQWCQDMGECLWVTLRNLQTDFNERFFDSELKEEELIINDQDLIHFIKNGCDLDENWYDHNSFENQVIAFVTEIIQALEFSNISDNSFETILSDSQVQEFGQALYNLLRHSLKLGNLSKIKENISQIKNFLRNNEIFIKEDNNDFLLRIKTLTNLKK